MALQVKVKSNVKNLQARFIKFAHKFPRIITMGLEQSGQFLKTAILRRTDRGQDINRNTFRAYSDAYAEEKGKSRVDLQDTNRMYNLLTQELLEEIKFKYILEVEEKQQRHFGIKQVLVIYLLEIFLDMTRS